MSPNKKEVVKPIRARATDSDQEHWQKFAKINKFASYSEWVRVTLNKESGNNHENQTHE